MDLFEDPKPGQNAPEFTVSELSGAVKRVIEGEFGRVRVDAESIHEHRRERINLADAYRPQLDHRQCGGAPLV
jgi:hypothetical protein